MLILFFTIILISEIIVAFWAISKIRKLDKTVCELNCRILPVKEFLTEKIKLEKEALISFNQKVKGWNSFVDKKKNQYLKIHPQVILTIASFILKNDWKKVVLIFDIIFGIKKLLAK